MRGRTTAKGITLQTKNDKSLMHPALRLHCTFYVAQLIAVTRPVGREGWKAEGNIERSMAGK